jgi:hypothetical protein
LHQNFSARSFEVVGPLAHDFCSVIGELLSIKQFSGVGFLITFDIQS